jgi:hypothetical protein
MNKIALILFLLVASGCSLTPAQQHVKADVKANTNKLKELPAEAKKHYCTQPYEVRLAEHKAALAAVGVATGNPTLGLIPYLDPCVSAASQESSGSTSQPSVPGIETSK